MIQPKMPEPGRAETEFRCKLNMPQTLESRSIQLVSAISGSPLRSALIEIAGPHRSLPPIPRQADSKGQLDLGPVTEPSVGIIFDSSGGETSEISIKSEELSRPGFTLKIK
jgi:hypothetical protein